MSSSVQISVVIPCLNEEEAVGAVVDQAWEGIRRSGRPGEVIVVDNDSTDGSGDVAAKHGATVVREARRGLRVSEIPIDYFPRTGESKLNRFGDAWRHVRFMLVYSPSWLYFTPGAILLLLGLVGALILAAGPVFVFGRTWEIHTMLACIAAVLVGAQVIQLGIFARAYALVHLNEHDPLVDRFHARVRLEHGLLLGFGLLVAGLAIVGAIFGSWAANGFGRLGHVEATALGFTLFGLGVQVVLGSFFLSLLTMRWTPVRSLVTNGRPAA